MKLEKILKRKSFKDLNVTDKQKHQIQCVIDWIDTQDNIKLESILKIIPRMIESGVDDLYIRRLVWNRTKCGNGYTLFKCLVLYSRKGYEYWESYCKRQSYTNSYEYKKKKHGWTEDEFNTYNKSRAVTIENCILKHGEIKGKKIWNKYLKQQAYTNTLEYFIEKYNGDTVKAKEFFYSYNRKKAVTFENLMIKYSNDENKVISVLENFYNRSEYYSKISQKLFSKIYGKLPRELQNKTYYGSLNKEFGKYSQKFKKYFMFDFVISNIKLCIEFNGDHYHANPLIYKPDDIPCVYPKEDKYISKALWKRDELKLKTLTDEGFECIIVWEKDFNDDVNYIVNKCLEAINVRNKTYKKL